MVRQGTRSGASGGAGIFERPPLHGGRRRAQVSRALRTRQRERAQERRVHEGQQVADDKDAEFVLTVRLNTPPEHEAEFNEWYNIDHVPALVGVPGVYCARRYVAVDGGSPKY